MAKSIMMLHGSSDIYGASKIFFNTAVLLHENGYKVYIVLSEDGPLGDMLRGAGITVLICKLAILRRKYFNLKGLMNRYVAFKNARKVLDEIVEQHNIEMIYSNTAAVLVGAFVAKKRNIKHIWHLHEIIEKPFYFSKLMGSIINRYSNKVIVVSGEVKKHWRKYVAEHKIITIHNGLDYLPYTTSVSSIKNELGIEDDQILIGMVARVNLWKGQKYFLKLAALLAKKYNNVRFVLAGDTYPGYEYLQDELNEIIKAEGLGNVVFDLGFRSDIPNILKGLDIFVLPSISPDPLPTVVLEAMASGRPVIATSHGGALEMVDDFNTGILIPWDDSKIAADYISHLVRDQDARKKMGAAGEQRVLDLFSKKQYDKHLLQTVVAL